MYQSIHPWKGQLTTKIWDGNYLTAAKNNFPSSQQYPPLNKHTSPWTNSGWKLLFVFRPIFKGYAMLNFQGVHENLLCASLTINSRILSMNHTVQEEDIMFLGTIQFQPPPGKKWCEDMFFRCNKHLNKCWWFQTNKRKNRTQISNKDDFLWFARLGWWIVHQIAHLTNLLKKKKLQFIFFQHINSLAKL